MYKKIFIANRADCAVRLIRGVHACGAQAVLAVARAERLRLVESEADEVVVTGAGRDAFMDAQNLIAAAKQRHCEALLPGWGFLSEEAAFAQQCRCAGIHFIGPSTTSLALFGDKLETRRQLSERLALVNDAVSCADPEFLSRVRAGGDRAWALKRRSGGGGKGVFLCENTATMLETLAAQVKTSRADAFFVEPFVRGRHIEFQVFGDGRGESRVLGVRDCSAQERCQKVMERHVPLGAESWLRPFAERVARVFGELGYLSWGTLETLVAADGSIHLLEVNPRLQVEHGVTEMATGVDLVRAALEIACGESLTRALRADQAVDSEAVDVVENRYYAKTTGLVDLPVFDGYAWPHTPFDDDPNYRLETGYLPGDIVTGIFDGMIARVIRLSKRSDNIE